LWHGVAVASQRPSLVHSDRGQTGLVSSNPTVDKEVLIMRVAVSLALGLALTLALVAGARADKEAAKEVKLKGKICCARCELMLDGQKKCATVIVVKKGDKELVYWFDEQSHQKFHDQICMEAKTGEVKGTVKKDGKKLILTIKDVKKDIKLDD
jgi:hypothetical protein